ncbi:MAG TPA: chemotaxis protein CheB [Gemmatimonadales bacterium]|nr:chemotaxis protein CheB [Gemmatimonadales bacterium]
MTRHEPFELVVLAASAGGIEALGRVLGSLPPTFPVPIAVVQHRSPHAENLLSRVLQRSTLLRVEPARTGQPLRSGTVYVAPADSHLIVSPDRSFGFTDGRKIRFVRSSANPLLESAAEVLGGRVVAVVLTGWGSDATDGVQAVKARGGIVIAQNRETSHSFGMPGAAIATGAVDHVLPLDQIGPMLSELAATDGAPHAAAPAG